MRFTPSRKTGTSLFSISVIHSLLISIDLLGVLYAQTDAHSREKKKNIDRAVGMNLPQSGMRLAVETAIAGTEGNQLR